jgi:transposase
MADFFWFSDEQWSRISSLLPVNCKGARRVDDRRALSGIVHALQSGGRWGNCPAGLWSQEDTLQPLCALGKARLLGGHFQCVGRSSWVSDWLFIDSTCIKVPRTT